MRDASFPGLVIEFENPHRFCCHLALLGTDYYRDELERNGWEREFKGKRRCIFMFFRVTQRQKDEVSL